MQRKFDAILLVDDDQATNYLHELYLKEWGLTENIFTALNGQEAIDFLQTSSEFQSFEKSLILLDINMPVMDGFEFLEAYENLNEQYKGAIVVVMLTSSLHTQDQARAQELNELSGYINKPLNRERMMQILDSLDVVNV